MSLSVTVHKAVIDMHVRSLGRNPDADGLKTNQVCTGTVGLTILLDKKHSLQ